MTAAGERRPRTAYLMGSNAVGETIYWQHPAVLLYTPLRTLVYVGADDRTYFAVERPSAQFAGGRSSRRTSRCGSEYGFGLAR